MCQDAHTTRDGDNYDESSDEDIYRMLLEDDDSDFMNSMYLFAIHHDKYCSRAERRQLLLTGL